MDKERVGYVPSGIIGESVDAEPNIEAVPLLGRFDWSW